MIKSAKIARLVMGEKIKFEGEWITNATFNRKTLKLKSFLLKNTTYLALIGWHNSSFGICE